MRSLPPIISGFAVHDGRSHPQEGGRERIREHGPVSCHGSQELRHGCLQPLATELSRKAVHPDKSLYHGRTIPVLSVSGPGGGPRGEAPLALDQRARGDQGHCSQDHALAYLRSR